MGEGSEEGDDIQQTKICDEGQVMISLLNVMNKVLINAYFYKQILKNHIKESVQQL
jgi:hypothetical protein